MAMTGAELAAARKAKMIAEFGPSSDQPMTDKWLLADSEAIVEYIQLKATVPNITVGTSTGTVQ